MDEERRSGHEVIQDYLKTLDGSDNTQRAKLIADMLSHWKAVIST